MDKSGARGWGLGWRRVPEATPGDREGEHTSRELRDIEAQGRGCGGDGEKRQGRGPGGPGPRATRRRPRGGEEHVRAVQGPSRTSSGRRPAGALARRGHGGGREVDAEPSGRRLQHADRPGHKAEGTRGTPGRRGGAGRPRGLQPGVTVPQEPPGRRVAPAGAERVPGTRGRTRPQRWLLCPGLTPLPRGCLSPPGLARSPTISSVPSVGVCPQGASNAAISAAPGGTARPSPSRTRAWLWGCPEDLGPRTCGQGSGPSARLVSAGAPDTPEAAAVRPRQLRPRLPGPSPRAGEGQGLQRASFPARRAAVRHCAVSGGSQHDLGGRPHAPRRESTRRSARPARPPLTCQATGPHGAPPPSPHRPGSASLPGPAEDNVLCPVSDTALTRPRVKHS